MSKYTRFLEYHGKILTRLFNGNSQRACYALALTIFSLGLFRDYLFVHLSPLPSFPPQTPPLVPDLFSIAKTPNTP